MGDNGAGDLEERSRPYATPNTRQNTRRQALARRRPAA